MAYDENIYARIISGTLSKEEEAALRKSGEWDEIQEILEASSELQLRAYDKDKGYERLRFSQTPGQKKSKVRRMYYWAGSVAAVVLLALAYVFLMQGDEDLRRAAYGETAQFALADATKVVLNDGSILDFSSFEAGGQRLVELTGEGYFKVTSGDRFVVQTVNGSIEVLGTQFNVRAWGEDIIVECYEGLVALNRGSVREEVAAGESVRCTPKGQIRRTNVTMSRPLWMDGLSRFSDAPLAVVVEEFERQYDIDVEMGVIDRPYSGAFEHDDMENALKKICDPMGLSFRIVDENTIVIEGE